MDSFWTVAHLHPGRRNVKPRHFPSLQRTVKRFWLSETPLPLWKYLNENLDKCTCQWLSFSSVYFPGDFFFIMSYIFPIITSFVKVKTQKPSASNKYIYFLSVNLKWIVKYTLGIHLFTPLWLVWLLSLAGNGDCIRLSLWHGFIVRLPEPLSPINTLYLVRLINFLEFQLVAWQLLRALK